jgi:hypothetical protein
MNARMFALRLLVPAALAGLCVDAAADTPIFAPVPSGGRDTLIVDAGTSAGATRIERWDPATHRKLTALSVNGKLVALLCVGDRLVCAAKHQLLVGPDDLSTPPRQVWHTSRDILRVAPFRKGVLVLVVDGAESAHPSAGKVYLFPSLKSPKPRLLSLRSIYNFWDIQSGDIDGDGRPVIALCTWSKTRYIHQYARRYFIYGMTNRDAYPRWRGSRLSKPYIEARLVKSGPGQASCAA